MSHDILLANVANIWKIGSFSSGCFFQKSVPPTNPGLYVGLAAVSLFLPLVARRIRPAGP